MASRLRIFDFVTKNSLKKVDMICGLVKYGTEVVLFRPRSLLTIWKSFFMISMALMNFPNKNASLAFLIMSLTRS